MALKDELRSLLGEVFGIDAGSIPDNADSRTLAGWDSQRHLLLVLRVESVYGISLSTDEVVEVQSFANLVRVVGEHTGQA